MNRFLLTLAVVGVLGGCSKPEEKTMAAPSSELVTATNTPAPPSPKPSPINLLLEKQTLLEAIDYVKPEMKDTFNSFPEAAVFLATWANKHNMHWKDLAPLQETRYGKIMKDADAERGKRVCTGGAIVEIEVDKSAGFPIYHAGIVDNNYRVTRVMAVGSTGELVAGSRVNQFCGVVIGKTGFQNAGGGTTSAVYAMGMFNLPENK